MFESIVSRLADECAAKYNQLKEAMLCAYLEELDYEELQSVCQYEKLVNDERFYWIATNHHAAIKVPADIKSFPEFSRNASFYHLLTNIPPADAVLIQRFKTEGNRFFVETVFERRLPGSPADPTH